MEDGISDSCSSNSKSSKMDAEIGELEKRRVKNDHSSSSDSSIKNHIKKTHDLLRVEKIDGRERAMSMGVRSAEKKIL